MSANGKVNTVYQSFSTFLVVKSFFKTWLQEIPGNKTKTFCRVCKAEIKAHKNYLTKYAGSVNHKKKTCLLLDLSKQQQKNSFQEKKVSTFEILLSIYIACFVSISNVDHLTDLIKAYIPGTSSINKTAKLHCTKCSALICKIIAPDIFKTIA